MSNDKACYHTMSWFITNLWYMLVHTQFCAVRMQCIKCHITRDRDWECTLSQNWRNSGGWSEPELVTWTAPAMSPLLVMGWSRCPKFPAPNHIVTLLGHWQWQHNLWFNLASWVVIECICYFPLIHTCHNVFSNICKVIYNQIFRVLYNYAMNTCRIFHVWAND